MGFKRDMRAFAQRVDQFMFDQIGRNAANEELKQIIKEQKETINDLLDRLMARDYPELRTFTIKGDRAEDQYEAGEDEALAGLVVAMEDKIGGKGED